MFKPHNDLDNEISDTKITTACSISDKYDFGGNPYK